MTSRSRWTSSSAAFATDPWFRWLYPGDDYQDRAGEWSRSSCRVSGIGREAWATEGGEAAAVWIRARP